MAAPATAKKPTTKLPRAALAATPRASVIERTPISIEAVMHPTA
jgi:hypothetical protein